MHDQARHRSLALEQVAKALAEWTVAAHAERDPSIRERYGAEWRTRWSGEVQQRIRHLAQSLAVESPALFEDSVAWASLAFASREVPRDDLRASLECLREVVNNQMPDPVAAEAAAYLNRAMAKLNGRVDEPTESNGADDLEMLRLAFLKSALQGDRREAQGLIAESVRNGTTVRDLYSRVFEPVQSEIGRMWHANEITVAEEHCATAIVESAMAALRMDFEPAERRPHTVLFTCIAGELHSLGLRMVADFFEMDGWNVQYLGANTPTEDVIHALRHHGADVLAVSATSVANLRELGDLIDAVRAQDDLGHMKILVGGRSFRADAELWRRLGADGYAASADQALQVAARLVASSGS